MSINTIKSTNSCELFLHLLGFCVIFMQCMHFLYFSFTEWKCGWTIAHRTIARLSHLWFRFCCWHSNGDVCDHESIIYSSRCCIFGAIGLWIWSYATWLCRCLLPLWRSKSFVAIPSYRKSLSVEWGCLFGHVRCHIPYSFVFIVEASYFKLNLISNRLKTTCRARVGNCRNKKSRREYDILSDEIIISHNKRSHFYRRFTKHLKAKQIKRLMDLKMIPNLMYAFLEYIPKNDAIRSQVNFNMLSHTHS